MSCETIIIPNGLEAEVAVYKEQMVRDYANNPLIEALPPLLTSQEVVDRLAYYPEYHSDERQLDSHYRIHMITRLFQIYQPLPMSIDLESKISRAIRQGYIARNPLNANLAKGYRKDYEKIKAGGNCQGGTFHSSACGFSLVGISGLGKTFSLNRILNMYPQVIVHSEYKSIPFSSYQIPVISLQCPYDGSVKGLLIEFFSTIDRMIGTNYYQKMIKTRATTDLMLTTMCQIVRNCSIGIITIDEIQTLSVAKSGGRDKMLNFFLSLVNNVSIPIVMIGTPRAISVLRGEFRQARRGIGVGGDMICDKMKKDNVWELLVRTLWHYQWTKKQIPLTEELMNVLYEETQGIPDLLTKLYAITQVHAISIGKEEITPYIIKKVARENMKLIQPMIKALKAGNVREIAKYQDISMIDLDIKEFINNTRQSVDLDLRVKAIKNRQKDKQKENIIEKKDETKEKNIKNRKNKNKELNPLDVRFIIEQGEKDGKNAYNALKQNGYIKSYEEDIVFER